MTRPVSPPDSFDTTLLTLVEYLREARDALKEAEKQFLVHSHRFKQPYTDQPDLTPWDNGVKRTAERCSRARARIAGALRAFPEAPEEPSICGVCHTPVREHKFRVAMEHLLGMTPEESLDVVHRMFEGIRGPADG